MRNQWSSIALYTRSLPAKLLYKHMISFVKRIKFTDASATSLATKNIFISINKSQTFTDVDVDRMYVSVKEALVSFWKVKPLFIFKLNFLVRDWIILEDLGEYHGYWCPGTWRRQVSSSSGLRDLSSTWKYFRLTVCLISPQPNYVCFVRIIISLTCPQVFWHIEQCEIVKKAGHQLANQDKTNQ